jgi:probable phosphoglycerate mutase
MSLTLYLLRHGETTYSQTGGYCGALDPELTADGELMAQAFADTYHKLHWTAIYVSPMQRTINTAAPLCDRLKMNMQLREGLKEIYYGEWEGQTKESVQAKHGNDYLRWLTEPAWNAPTGGETATQVASRAILIMSEIREKYADGNILVVSHKATIRIILCTFLGIDLGRYRDRLNVLTGSVSVVRFTDYGPLLEKLGDRSHLDQRLIELPGT